MVYKKDSFNIESFKITSSGYLDISGIVTRSGVFQYEDGGELRPASEIFRQDSLDSMFAIPVTWEHPPDLLHSETIPLYQRGFVASKATVEKYDDDRGVVKLSSIIIQDKKLISEIVENRIKQFSLGYSCDLDEKKGIFDNVEFVRVQKNVFYNHLAVVKDARCGDICSITKKEDAMEYKKDCACQSKIKQDAKEEKKEEEKEEAKKDEAESKVESKAEEKKEEKKDEAMPVWASKIIEMLEKMAGNKSDKKDEMPESMSDEDDLYDSKKKDKRKDSIHETVSQFNFSTPSETRTDSNDFKAYNRDNYLQSLLNRKG